MSIRKHLAVGAATIFAASALSVAAAAPSSAAPAPCGYYEVGSYFYHSSWYNNCRAGAALVYVNAGLDWRMCVSHGDHEIHAAWQNLLNDITSAYRIGGCRL